MDLATTLTLSTRQALNPFDCLQFHREGFLAIHEAWTQDAVKEVRGIVDGLYQSAGRGNTAPCLIWSSRLPICERRPSFARA